MKNKNNIFLSVAILSLSIAVSGNIIANKISFSAAADDKSYQLILNYDKNKFDLTSSSSYVQTELGNKVGFTYSGVSTSSNRIWDVLNDDGYIYNTDPIHGLKSISINVGSASSIYRIYYSFTGEEFVEYSQFTGSKQFNFNETMPNYFKITNTSGSDIEIESITLSYSCVNEYYTLSVASNDVNKGTVSTSGGLYRSGTTITLVATCKEYYLLDGWYVDNEENPVSIENSYTFAMPSHDYNLTAIFSLNEEEWNKVHGVIPVVDEENKTVTYGLYPQTVVDDETLISTLNSLGPTLQDKETGWFKYKNEYYCYATANLYSPDEIDYKFDNGDVINNGEKYWFNCEAITWNILSSSNGEYYLLTEKLLDAHYYFGNSSTRTIGGNTIYPNNYEYSDIRAWLNGYDGSDYGVPDYTSYMHSNFTKWAFDLGSSYIKTTEVDNSVSTTTTDPETGTNPYVCENTQDKVFLPSYQDYLNSDYGFSNDKSRFCLTTDYARATGAYIDTSTDYLNNGDYWTRSPAAKYSYCGTAVYGDGTFGSASVHFSSRGVRPCITLQIS